MRVRMWIFAFVTVALSCTAGAIAGSRTVELQCVNKAGENMYRAADGSVVWTDSCGVASRCADATVTVSSSTNGSVIRWYGGGTCHVVNAALARGAGHGDGGGSSGRSRKSKSRQPS
jgi:hypothetical protein